jgi:peroxiredoxin
MNSKKIILLVVVVLAALFGLFRYKKYRMAPAIELFKQEVYDENNEKADLSAYKGKKLIISYYASWCGDCLKEMKTLDEVREAELKDVVIIAITDESLEKMVRFKEKEQYPFTFLHLNKSFDKINIYTIPVTYVINTKGELVYEKVGAINWKDPSLMSHVKALF